MVHDIPTIRYFDFQGRAEPLRFALAAAGVEFNDTVVPWDQWPLIKEKEGRTATLPCSSLPTYQDQQVGVLCQTFSVLRHIARTHNLYGEGLRENAQVDMILESVHELLTPYINWVASPEFCDALTIKYATSVQESFHRIECLLRLVREQNQPHLRTHTPLAVGNSMTIADTTLLWMTHLHFSRPCFNDLLDLSNYPILKAHYEHLLRDERIETYLRTTQNPTVNYNGRG